MLQVCFPRAYFEERCPKRNSKRKLLKIISFYSMFMARGILSERNPGAPLRESNCGDKHNACKAHFTCNITFRMLQHSSSDTPSLLKMLVRNEAAVCFMFLIKLKWPKNNRIFMPNSNAATSSYDPVNAWPRAVRAKTKNIAKVRFT